MSKEILVIFPSVTFSGHEKMALQILNNLNLPKRVFCLKAETYLKLSEKLNVSEIKVLDFPRLFYKKKVLLISGSPYGLPHLKLSLWLLRSEVIEYTPFPELNCMRDRLHHHIMPFINKVTIRKRILIDDWQQSYSAVKDVIIVRNKV